MRAPPLVGCSRKLLAAGAARECYSVFMSTRDQLAADALSLPEDERARLALRLLDSLDAPDVHTALDDDALAQEIGKRAQSVLDGEADERPFDEVQARVLNHCRGYRLHPRQ